MALSVNGGLFMSESCDALFSSWLSEMSKQLEAEGTVHRCGKPFEIGFLKAGGYEGRVLLHLPHEDAYEAVMFARCSHCEVHGPRGQPNDSYNYTRFRIGGHMMSRMVVDPTTYLKDVMLRAWDDLVTHLRGLVGQLNEYTVAEIAEWVTKLLASRGTCLLSEVVKEFDLDEGKTDKLRDYMHMLGFIRDPYWRTMDVQLPSITSYTVQTAAMIPTMTMPYETRIDTLLALPAEHPLAA